MPAADCLSYGLQFRADLGGDLGQCKGGKWHRHQDLVVDLVLLLLGICLGMQALYEVSEENGHIPALGLLPGRIVHFPEGKLKVPHMGWNELVIHRPHEVLEGLPLHSYVYFVHSYYKTPGDTEDIIASADYGVTVPAVVGKDNVLGFQFHPEKSGSVGMAIWDRLAKWLMK